MSSLHNDDDNDDDLISTVIGGETEEGNAYMHMNCYNYPFKINQKRKLDTPASMMHQLKEKESQEAMKAPVKRQDQASERRKNQASKKNLRNIRKVPTIQ